MGGSGIVYPWLRLAWRQTLAGFLDCLRASHIVKTPGSDRNTTMKVHQCRATVRLCFVFETVLTKISPRTGKTRRGYWTRSPGRADSSFNPNHNPPKLRTRLKLPQKAALKLAWSLVTAWFFPSGYSEILDSHPKNRLFTLKNES